MRRREFITLIGGTAACPLAARAQQPTKPVVGLLSSGSAALPHLTAAFNDGLKSCGYVPERNVIGGHWLPTRLAVAFSTT